MKITQPNSLTPSGKPQHPCRDLQRIAGACTLAVLLVGCLLLQDAQGIQQDWSTSGRAWRESARIGWAGPDEPGPRICRNVGTLVGHDH